MDEISSQTPVNPSQASTDVLVVGGGPAGLAAAIALRQRGLACVVVEARSPAIDKACGEGLMPDSIDRLASLGVQVAESDGYAFRGIRFANRTHQVDASFPNRAGIGIRRPQLHARLAARAQEAGAQLLWNSHIQLPASAGDRSAKVNGQPLNFRWLVGADGEGSLVRRWASLHSLRKESLRYGFRTHYRVAPWSDFVEIHWGCAGQLYITPVAPDCVCVVYVTRDRRCDRTRILPEFPEIADRLRSAPTLSAQRGAVSATRTLRRVASGWVALIGDASGSADAIAGEGLAMSFRQADALAASIAAGSLAPYRRDHARIARLPHAMAAILLTMDRSQALEVRAMRALSASPSLFRELLSAHMGARSLTGAALRCGPRMVWNLLSAAHPA